MRLPQLSMSGGWISLERSILADPVTCGIRFSVTARNSKAADQTRTSGRPKVVERGRPADLRAPYLGGCKSP